MTRLFSFIFCLLSTLTLSGQTFKLTDKNFNEGDIYIADKIYFDFSKWTLRPESYSKLDSIVAFLTQNKHLTIEVSSHTDSRASDAYSVTYTGKRAKSVAQYFIDKGINSDRLVAKGYEHTKPIISDDEIDKLKTEEEKLAAHQVNRRIELKILKVETRYFKLTDTVFNVGDVYTIAEYKFYWNTYFNESTLYLDSIVNFMKLHTDIKVEVGVYYDTRSSEAYNNAYTVKRAESIRNYLLEHGIKAKRVDAVGYGEAKPINSDVDIAKLKTEDEKEEAHQLNRRIELKILKVD